MITGLSRGQRIGSRTVVELQPITRFGISITQTGIDAGESQVTFALAVPEAQRILRCRIRKSFIIGLADIDE